MRCPRCGNENSEENRFCGMCGTKLLSNPAAQVPTPVGVAASPSSSPLRSPSSPASVVPAPSRPQVAAPPRQSAYASEDSPVISGPSFLGLNDPAPRSRAALSSDPHPSGSVDYLLEDEEPPRRGVAGKLALFLLVLALVGGYAYFRVKWLNLTPRKPAAVAQDSEPTDATTTPAPVPASPAATPSATPTPTASQPPAAEAAKPAADSSTANSPSATNSAGPANTPASAPASTPAANAEKATEPASKTPADGDSDAGDAANSSADSGSAAAAPAAKETTPAPPEATSPKPKRAAAEPRTPKPHAGVASASSADAVIEAEKYIYGRGVAQDCDHGMRLLKPAAAQANPKAMIDMGALYSAGLCTPHDLPTAYRWFAMALRKDPENQSAQADLQKIWGEMTQPERQLAIRLSQ